MLFIITKLSLSISAADLCISESLKAVASRVTEFDDVIYHSTSDDAVEKMAVLTDLGARKVRLYSLGYSDILAVQVVKASGGVIYEDDGVIDNLDVLRYITDITAHDELRALNGSIKELQIVENYATSIMNAFRSEDAQRLNQLRDDKYLKTFCEASLLVVKSNKDEMSAHDAVVCEMICFVRNMLLKVEEWAQKRQATLEELHSMERELQTLRQKSSLGEFNKITNYPLYSVSSSVPCKVLYVKEYTPCPYLTSLLVCYVKYLQNMRGLTKARLLIIHEDCSKLKLKYAEFFKVINPVTIEEGAPGAVFYATCEPTKDVLDALVGSSDVLIVIDRLNRLNDLISGRNVVVKNAFASIRDLKLFVAERNLEVDSTIQNIGRTKWLINAIQIPQIKGYVTSSPMIRETLYLKCAVDIYNKLDINLQL